MGIGLYTNPLGHVSNTKTTSYMAFDIDMIKEVYSRYPERIAAARKIVNKPLTLSEKILRRF